ncbi:multidrug effflux MFS transporter [Roseobacter sp. WL0113]|uniref:Multidrug effflux MFS transporter n=2 Tax=Roseobacter sinensis TaxID=2931391 RepID=A0ABT3BBH6_9RHOB|nr:multidrug effflux MFS transporter [Roseobacter sp. WL0113]MCV3270910.1 multidrug effflux MFS transporter [Roseobacter sp. WL0113]
MGRVEFIALMAMMFATIAFSIDAMLPALPDIARELTPEEPTRAPLIMTAFVLGMGLGTFFAGPLSDALGRRSVMLCGATLYIAASAVAWASSSFEVVLAARIVQGIGAAGPRVVSIAVIRDLYAGREMAKIVSIVMMIFTLVPGFAPTLGYLIMLEYGWRGIFAAFIVFSVITVLWLGLRLPETLAPENRRPLRPRLMISAVGEMFAHPIVRLSIIVQTLCMSILFTVLMMIQPVYEHIYDKQDTFHFWFGGIALVSAIASFLNAMLVVRLGMRRLITMALAVQIVLSLTVILHEGAQGMTAFAIFALWQAYVFFQAGLTIGNLNAIAMEPMGHIAGMAASVIGAVSTVLAAAIASPIGLLFDGTIRPLVGAVFVLAFLAFIVMRYMGRVEARLPAE